MKVYQVGQKIEGLKLGEKHDLSIATLSLPAPSLKKGDKGERVKALQEALIRLGFLTGQPSSAFDAATQHALGKFQHLWELPSQGVYDAATRTALGKALAGDKPPATNHKPPPPKKPPPPHPPPPQTGSVREKIVANAEWGIKNEPRIHYAEVRPIPCLNEPNHLPLTTDCSGFATLCYKWAGAPDPNGLSYDGQGYTGTLLSHMHHIQQHEVEPGDLVVFGGGTGHHVCVVLDKGGSWLASHGSESGPIKISFGDEHAAQSSYGASEVHWLSILHAAAAKAAAAPEHKPAEHKPAEHKPAPEHKPAEHKAEAKPKPAEHHEAKPAEHHEAKPEPHKPPPPPPKKKH